MKRIILAFIAAFIVLNIAIAAFVHFKRQQTAPGESMVSPSGALECTRENYNDYLEILPQAGRMGINLQIHPDNGETLQRMLAAFDALALEGPDTVVVAAEHRNSKLYVSSCAQSQCTMNEMTAAEAECMEDNMENFGNDCVYLAIRFQDRNYCLIVPEQE